MRRVGLWAKLAIAASALVLASPAFAQVPGEVSGVAFTDAATLVWNAETGADHYNLYRGDAAAIALGPVGRCHLRAVAGTLATSLEEPAEGQVYAYVVTGESLASGEGSGGTATGGAPRFLPGCVAASRAHVLNRAGTGWNEWGRDRIAALGIQGYIDEQLDPSSIDESTNTELNAWLPLYDPPPSIIEHIALHVVYGVYGRRQLEEQLTMFWANHFNTHWLVLTPVFKAYYPECAEPPEVPLPECDPDFNNFFSIGNTESTLAQHRETEDFRYLALHSNFRQILETSALSPAMILYLDTYLNKVGNPNENHARELVELHSMGVDGGYTEQDVAELARVLTGWQICKKATADIDDPLASCIANYWEALPEGEWTAHFDPAEHDCTSKTIFAGTPQELVLADTCSSVNDGVNDLMLALDAIAAHPSTARFISKKILQLLVTDEPTQEMIDALVAEWNDSAHPQGVGDLREVTRAAFELDIFMDLAAVPEKVKTPMEHFISAFRAVRGNTDGIDRMLGYIIQGSHIPFFNPVPTGYSELGDDWIDTNGFQRRQNIGVELAVTLPVDRPNFSSDPIALLNDNGIVTTPGNETAIVDFMATALFGGNLSPADKQIVVDFLLTGDDGTPDPLYDDTRVRQAVGLMLGFADFQKQ